MIVEGAARIAPARPSISPAARAVPDGVLRLLVNEPAAWGAIHLLGPAREATMLHAAAAGEGRCPSRCLAS